MLQGVRVRVPCSARRWRLAEEAGRYFLNTIWNTRIKNSNYLFRLWYNIYMTYTKYTKELMQDAVNNSLSIAGVARYLGLRIAGGTQTHISNKIKMYQIDISHFTGQGHNKGKIAKNRMPADEILIILPDGSYRAKPDRLRRALQEKGVPFLCNSCGLSNKWNGKPLQLEVNHISGDWLDNRFENLEFLCPNCHSQDEDSNKPHKYRN